MRRFRNAIILLVKLFLDRRDDRGADEFRFRWRFGNSKHHRIDVQARSGGFRTTVFLRKGTSDLPTFEQVFGNNDYNLRRLARWGDIEHWYSEISLSGTPLILDLGANIGLAALYFHKNWPAAHIIAVEPSAQNMAALHRNTGHIDTIQPLLAAAAGRDGMVRIANPNDEAWAFRTEHLADPSDNGVSALSVPSIIDQAPPTERPYRPFIIKIDIEGFEHDLFAENCDWIARFPILIIELHDWMLPRSGNSRNFLKQITGRNCDFIMMGENIVCISNDPLVAA